MATRIKNTRIISRETDRFAYYSPFNDAILETDYQSAIRINGLISSGNQISTVDINQYRQGIELAQEAYRFMGTGPKIWAGNIKGCTTIQTIGQMLSFVEFENTTLFEERIRFNPVTYITSDQHENQEMIFNDGPQQNKETRIDVFTSPYLKGLDSNEALSNAHDIRASIEDGNPLGGYISEKNSQIEQFFDFRDHTLPPFLESGERFYGQDLPGNPFIERDSGSSILRFFNGTTTNEIFASTLTSVGETPIYVLGPQTKPFESFQSLFLNASNENDVENGTFLINIGTTPTERAINVSTQMVVYISNSILDLVDHGNSGSVLFPKMYLYSIFSSSNAYNAETSLISQNWSLSLTKRSGYLTGSNYIEVQEPRFVYSDIHNSTFVSTSLSSSFTYVKNEFGITINSGSYWNLNQWNHIAFVRTSSVPDPITQAYTCKLYVNGQKITESYGAHHTALSSSVFLPMVGTPALEGSRFFDSNNFITQSNVFMPAHRVIYNTGFSGSRLSSVHISSFLPNDLEMLYKYEKLSPFLNTDVSSYFLSGVFTQGFLQDGYPPLPPYEDNGNLPLISELQTDNSELITILHNSMSVNLDNDLRKRYGIKSTPAGQDVYGPNQARYGTDSICYAGFTKGS